MGVSFQVCPYTVRLLSLIPGVLSTVYHNSKRSQPGTNTDSEAELEHGLVDASSYFLVLWQLDLHMRPPGDCRGFMTE